MKRILIALLATLFLGTLSYAQGSKSLKQASKSLSKFTKDFSNQAALDEAKMHIEEAFKDEKVSSSAKSWNTRGDILMNIGDAQIKQKLLNPAFEMKDVTSAIGAVDAYLKALEIATKGGDKKNAIKGLKAAEGVLNNIGIDLYQNESYLDAFSNFDAEIKASNKLGSLNEASRLDEGTLRTEKLFFAGLTGFYGEQYERSIDLLKEAEATGTSDGTLYQFLYEAHNKVGKMDEGVAYLTKGRELFPDDSGLLFSEINYYLGKGELQEMISKLEIALEREPDNTSVMTTLGQVYDQLHVKSNAAGDAEQAGAYFDKSLENYSKAQEMNPEDFDVNYSIGALYYNKAASYTESLNEAANDFSAAGNKKYDEIKAEMGGYFEKALPYFLKSDEIRSNDRNTLIALKEIYVRKDMFDKSEEYKNRLESLPE